MIVDDVGKGASIVGTPVESATTILCHHVLRWMWLLPQVRMPGNLHLQSKHLVRFRELCRLQWRNRRDLHWCRDRYFLRQFACLKPVDCCQSRWQVRQLRLACTWGLCVGSQPEMQQRHTQNPVAGANASPPPRCGALVAGGYRNPILARQTHIHTYTDTNKTHLEKR